MLTNLKKRNEGFTIIEVLIVLAIAGLIMLIVFLAVPALQRNSRNTQRKNDVSGVLGAVQEVINNNNGKMSLVDVTKINAAAPEPAYYAAYSTSLTIASGNTNAAVTSVDALVLVKGGKCNTSGDGSVVAGTTRQIAIAYAIESGSGATSLCTNS